MTTERMTGFRYRYFSFLFFVCVLLVGCVKDDVSELDESVLSDYILMQGDRERADLIACAGGKQNGLSGVSDQSTTIFYYPIEGATDIKYFEALNVSDSVNFNNYIEIDLEAEPLFNGYMGKFDRNYNGEDRMVVVTYLTPGKIHVCTPIRLKTNTKPSEVNPSLLTIQETGVSSMFAWETGVIDENVIFFQVISDESNNFISGTYTIENNFTFYDLSNVVFNITDESANPTLSPNNQYGFVLMGVSEDNWINLFVEEVFETN